MTVNKELQDKIFNIIHDQLSSDQPPEVKATYNRLNKEGFDEMQSKQLIGQCVILELYEILRTDQPFNFVRYVKNLNDLPQKPKVE